MTALTQLQDLRAVLNRSHADPKQLEKAKRTLSHTTPNQVSHVLEELEPKTRVMIFRLLDKDKAAEVFELLDPHQQAELVGAMEDPELLPILEALDPDDRVRLFEELPAKITKRLIAGLSPEARKVANELLAYPHDSAGRVMSPRYQAVRDNATAGAALAAIRGAKLRDDELRVIFVIDEKRFFKGIVPVTRLLRADPQTPVGELIEATEAVVRVDDDRLKAASLLKDLDLPAVAVTDREGRMVGTITFDDVIDVLEEEASETMYQKAGIGDLLKQRDTTFSQRLTSGSILYPIRVRILFLLITLAGGFAVGGIIDAFEGTLEAIVAVAIFIPVIMDMGGNVGTQSTTIFARGLALRHINVGRYGRYLAREGVIGLIMGAVLGTVGGLGAYWWQGLPNGVPQLGLAVGLSLFIVITVASLLGFILPYLMIRLGFDHGPGADPFITTIKDFTGLLLYFYLINVFIGVGEPELGAFLGQLLPV